jgi:hypothetical protein
LNCRDETNYSSLLGTDAWVPGIGLTAQPIGRSRWKRDGGDVVTITNRDARALTVGINYLLQMALTELPVDFNSEGARSRERERLRFIRAQLPEPLTLLARVAVQSAFYLTLETVGF